jgi:subtilisin family serine protease
MNLHALPRALRKLLVPSVVLSFLCLGWAQAGLDVPPDAPIPDDLDTVGDDVLTTVLDFDAAEAADASLDALMAKASSGPVRVIAVLAGPDSAGSEADRTAAIASAQDTVATRVEEYALSPIKRFVYSPLLALETDAAGLHALMADPDVVSVQEDVADRPQLYDSIPLINADDAWALGYQGSGKVVAVLDTGVNKIHPFLDAGKVGSEACYSTTSGSRSTSLCPGGASSSTAPGSGLDCSLTISGCGHGTHVAGIAAGFSGATNSGTIHGVGRLANVLAIQVFSRFDSFGDCFPSPAPCALAYVSDQIAALERVYALRNIFDIAAVNMSLGGGAFTGTCDGDARKPIIDLLRNAGIATVASAGNGSQRNAMGAPACISTTISVACSSKSDTYCSFTDVSASTDLIAPGLSICSSENGSIECGSGFGFKSGTSMSAPHVAGAWALFKTKNGFASVNAIESALEVSGESLKDGRTSGTHTKPRINVDAALARISAGPSRGFHWDRCEHVWQSGSATWCWLKAGKFWITSSNDLTEEVFIEATASTPRTSANSKYLGYNVTTSGTINYVRLWQY